MLNDVYAPSGVVPPQKSAGKWLTLADWIVTNYEENAPAGAEQSKAALQQAKEMAIQCVRPTCASDMLMHHLHSSFFVFCPGLHPHLSWVLPPPHLYATATPAATHLPLSLLATSYLAA